MRRPFVFVPVNLLQLMNTLVPLPCNHVVGNGDRGNPISSDWIPAVPLSWGSKPVRPVTLRRHLSIGFAFCRIALKTTLSNDS
jgi:hypothetical protein